MSSFVQLAASFIVVLGFLLATGGLPFSVPVESWPWAIFLGLINTGLGCYLYFSSFESLSAQTVATFGYLEPLSAVLCAFVFLGESMSAVQLLGCVLIVMGALMGQRRSDPTR